MNNWVHALIVILVGGFFVILFASNTDATQKLMGTAVYEGGVATAMLRGYATGKYPAGSGLN